MTELTQPLSDSVWAGPLLTDADYREALREIEQLFDAEPGTPEDVHLEVLLALAVVEEKRTEAKTQLQHYQQTLQKKYGAVLKLRTYAVVSIGLERLIWEEVSG